MLAVRRDRQILRAVEPVDRAEGLHIALFDGLDEGRQAAHQTAGEDGDLARAWRRRDRVGLPDDVDVLPVRTEHEAVGAGEAVDGEEALGGVVEEPSNVGEGAVCGVAAEGGERALRETGGVDEVAAGRDRPDRGWRRGR